MSQYESRLFINGELTSSAAGKSYPLLNPATNQWIADIPIARADDIEKAVIAAERAQPQWAQTPARNRAAIIRRFATLMNESRERLSELDSVCMGKPLHDGLDDVEESCNISNYFSGLVEIAGGETSLNSPGFLNISLRQPFGVVAAIVPWNFPIMMWCHEIIPACGAGNAMILKTSEKSPLSGILLAELAHQAGFPPGIVNVVSGPGETGALLSSHMRIRKISFTGSTRAGRAIMQAAARSNLKAVSLELGGKSPLIVFEDADLPMTAAAAVRSIVTNSGQICTASSRTYVQKSVAKEFKDLLVQQMQKLQLGNPLQSTTDLGPQADEVQAGTVARYLEVGGQEGKVLVGGHKAPDVGVNYIQPTIFTDIADQGRLNVEEVFGPVMVLHQFDSEDEAIRRANHSEYGLYASVFTTDVNKALRVARALEAGNVGVNCTSPDGAYELPFGGWKSSGIGRQKGSGAVLDWTEVKSVYIKHST